MTVDIQYTSSEANRVNKQILGLLRLEGTLRNNSNTIDPEILIEGNIQDVAGANYLTIYSFKRHYFIRNIESIRNGLYLIRAHVDVLTTFATASVPESYCGNVRISSRILRSHVRSNCGGLVD